MASVTARNPDGQSPPGDVDELAAAMRRVWLIQLRSVEAISADIRRELGLSPKLTESEWRRRAGGWQTAELGDADRRDS